MMAAIAASAKGIDVTLLEKNEKLGKKLYITGKGRCNLTNNTDLAGLMSNVITNPRFLYSAFSALDSRGLMTFFEDIGVPLKTERGGRVFPVSDKSGDINDAIRFALRKSGCKIRLNCEVKGIASGTPSGANSTTSSELTVHTNAFNTEKNINRNTHISSSRDSVYDAPTVSSVGKSIKTTAVLVATGGLSYPSTGSIGDGYTWAKNLGHTIIDTHPSLVPLVVPEPWVASLSGLSLKNIRCIVRIGKKIIYEELGEMLFTPSGVTGPLILSASAFLAAKLHQNPTITIDLKPGLTSEQLDARILRDFAERQNKDFINALDSLLPQRLIEVIVGLCDISPHKKVHAITKSERLSLVYLLKNLEIKPTETAGYSEAVITKGGVNTKEVNPSTLMSKNIPGLFFAGEVLDVDALTGGYNLQIAFSTGYLAGLSAVDYIRGITGQNIER